MKAVGFDSIKLELGAFSTKFEGLLGVGITVVDEDSFKKKYVAVLKSLFNSIGVSCDRLVCKSVDIARFVRSPESMLQFVVVGQEERRSVNMLPGNWGEEGREKWRW